MTGQGTFDLLAPEIRRFADLRMAFDQAVEVDPRQAEGLAAGCSL